MLSPAAGKGLGPVSDSSCPHGADTKVRTKLQGTQLSTVKTCGFIPSPDSDPRPPRRSTARPHGHAAVHLLSCPSSRTAAPLRPPPAISRWGRAHTAPLTLCQHGLTPDPRRGKLGSPRRHPTTVSFCIWNLPCQQGLRSLELLGRNLIEKLKRPLKNKVLE